MRIRAGLHVGEVELRDADVTGLDVVIGARICDHANSGRTLVTPKVQDLVTGSDIQLAAAGERHLKGIPDTWQLYELV